MKLNVLGTLYDIHFTDEIEDTDEAYCDAENRKICIKASLSEHERMLALLHEFIHAIDFESGLYQCTSHEVMEISAETKAKCLLANFELRLKNT